MTPRPKRHNEEGYLDLLNDILEHGDEKDDRTDTGTYSLFGPQLTFDLRDGLPVITTKEIFLDGVIYELLWFLRGGTNIEHLNENDVHIWDEWADENGEVGPVYGKQWREWKTYHIKTFDTVVERIDQLKRVIKNIRENPESRRHVVSAWKVDELDDMNLPPCHVMFQFNVVDNEWLDCAMYQRSADMFLGVPFNITSYSLLTNLVADVTGLKSRRFIHDFGDAHIYKNHVDQVKTQLSREPYSFPDLELESKDDIDDFEREDITVVNYEHDPKIEAPVSV